MGNNYMVKIDPDAFKAWLQDNGHRMNQLSMDLGKSASYLSGAICRGEIASQTLQLLALKYGLDPKDVMERPHKAQEPTGFSLDLMVKPDRVRVAVMHNGNELYSAFAKINGETETKLMQAISYAAHLCYKLAEQKELRKG